MYSLREYLIEAVSSGKEKSIGKLVLKKGKTTFGDVLSFIEEQNIPDILKDTSAAKNGTFYHTEKSNIEGRHSDMLIYLSVAYKNDFILFFTKDKMTGISWSYTGNLKPASGRKAAEYLADLYPTTVENLWSSQD